MALTIQQLYDKYTGREADPSGLKFWTEGFLGNGDTVIDANEEASFARAVAAARAQGTEPAAVNPVATPTTTAPAATTTTTTPAATTATTATTSAPINLNNGTFLTAAGKIVDASGNVLADTGYAATATLTQQILGQNLTDKWQGQGWGTAQANASDMARMMATAGITDIKQFGVIPDLEPVVPIDTLYNGKRVFTQTDEDGKTSRYIYEPTGKTLTYNSTDTGEVTYPESRVVEVPKDAKLETIYGVARDGGEYGSSYVPVDQSKIKTVDGKLVGDTGKTTFGNKVTGQAIANNYETGSNAFGGTTAGKGNTGYRVQFAPDGTPLFYTTGASSSDIGQLMPLIQIGLAASGAGGLLGNAILGAGASEIATGALGNAILGGATAGLSGNDILQGALLGGAGGALSGYLQGGPIDASNMTATQFNDAIENQLISSMQGAGLTNAQINQFLENASAADIASITSALPVTNASDTLLIDAARAPITATDLINTLAQVPTVAVTSNRPEQVSPDVLNAVTSILSGETTIPPEIEITTERPRQPDTTVITPPITPVVTTPIVTTPVVTTPTGTTSTTTDTPLTASDIIRIIGIGTTIAGINAATDGVTTGGVTQYPIINVPTTWTTPPKPSVGPATVLPPINFGDRNLLRGTQWEKFLDPKYGLVPEPIQYSQPSSLSYNDLMGILGSKQGYPAKSSLSINDIISGIQNQYGQAPSSAMG